MLVSDNMHNVTLITGDGIGPEVADAARQCIEATGVVIDWDVQTAGAKVIKTEGDPLPPRVIESIRQTGTALKAPITTPIGKGFRSVNVRLRQSLELFANVRPARSIKGIGITQDTDIIIVRENTEGLYAGIEFDAGEVDTKRLTELVKDTRSVSLASDCAVTLRPISKSASKRICDFAFEWAKTHKRSKVTCVTKSNIMKFTDGIFLSQFSQASKENPEVGADHRLVDAVCMQLVQSSKEFDVMVMPNLYGDILSDLVAGLVGGLGVVPGGNIGNDHAVFEAVHGSAPDIAGKNIANPTALILSSAMMLDHLKEHKAASTLRCAIESVLCEGVVLTPDLGGSAKTNEFTEQVINTME